MFGMVLDFNSTLLKLIDERICNILTSNLKLDLGVRKSISLEDGNSVR